jgi:hypothetical protein
MVNFNTITANDTVGRMATAYDFGQVTAVAGESDSFSPRYLTVANFQYPNPEEVGIGVCGWTDTASVCATSINGNSAVQQFGLPSSIWSGDTTEVDNLGAKDQLKLIVNAGYQFTGQFILGSLDDNNGSGGFEDGYVTYGANTVHFTRTATGAVVDMGTGTIGHAAGFGADVFLLTLGNFSPSITQVMFAAGAPGNTTGTNNDYLVTAADVTPVPLPAAGWLLLGGLGALRTALRRRSRG